MNKKSIAVLSIALLCLPVITACSQPPTVGVLKRGYISFEDVKVGMPEEPIKKAIFSFSPDPPGCTGGKVQYLSRRLDKYGGQYIIQSRNHRVFQVQIYHISKPIAGAQALVALKQLVPSGALKGPLVTRAEQHSLFYYFGNGYTGELVLAGKPQGAVAVINASYAPSSACQIRSQLPLRGTTHHL